MTLADVMKAVVRRTRYARFFVPRYELQFLPPNLCVLVQSLMQTRDVQGSVLEVGCFRGATTIFLSKTLEAIGCKKRYFALDTFQGFVPEHLRHESISRGKTMTGVDQEFRRNSQGWFDRAMEINGFDFVTSIKADAAVYDYGSIAPISFALIDVDLYVPVKEALRRVLPLVSPGGIVIVDDCRPNNKFDGAYQAYTECAQAAGLPVEIVNDKLGFIRV